MDFQCFCLQVKGSYYSKKLDGTLTDRPTAIAFFATQHEAIAFRRKHDHLHRIDEARLLPVHTFIEDAE